MKHHRLIRIVCLFIVLLGGSSASFSQSTNYFTVFPQFASGGGWSSDIFIDNQGTLAAIIGLSFYGDDGGPLVVDITLGVGSSFSLTINGGNTSVIRGNSGGALKTGYAVISFPSGASVRASEVFRYQPNGVVTSALGVAQQIALSCYSFPAEVDGARGVNTALAIANGSFDSTSSAAQRVVVSLIRSDGTLKGTATVNLAAGEHVSKYLNDATLFPGLDSFIGTVCVSAARNFGLVALRQDQSVFATVSVDAGPILTPFMLNTAAVSEVEPNSSIDQAQRISGPTVFSGNISVAGDIDYFKFTANDGEILTAVVSTVNLNSGLDSILSLINSERTIIAQNDENGLFFSSDSFIQIALPAAGTYYLAVTDFQRGGGANGTYRLHVQWGPPVQGTPQAQSKAHH